MYDVFSTAHHLQPQRFFRAPPFMLLVCYGKHIVYPANFHFSSLSHTQLTLTRMHQAQENIKRVKRKSNGLWQFECEVKGRKKFRSTTKDGAQDGIECVWDFLICVNVKNLWNFHNSICILCVCDFSPLSPTTVKTQKVSEQLSTTKIGLWQNNSKRKGGKKAVANLWNQMRLIITEHEIVSTWKYFLRKKKPKESCKHSIVIGFLSFPLPRNDTILTWMENHFNKTRRLKLHDNKNDNKKFKCSEML
jgi:hypothetical protein